MLSVTQPTTTDLFLKWSLGIPAIAIVLDLLVGTYLDIKPSDAFLEANKDNTLKSLFCFFPQAGMYSCVLYAVAFRTCFFKFLPIPVNELLLEVFEKPAYFFIASAWHMAENALCFCLQNKFPTSTANNVSYRGPFPSSRVAQSNSSPIPL